MNANKSAGSVCHIYLSWLSPLGMKTKPQIVICQISDRQENDSFLGIFRSFLDRDRQWTELAVYE